MWNRTKGRATGIVFMFTGAQEGERVADAVKGVDVVITMLADDNAVRAVAIGE